MVGSLFIEPAGVGIAIRVKTRTTILLVVCILGGLCFINRGNRHLVQARGEYGITQASPLINAPPLVVFTTVALGGFRGIIADFLWMRSARLQYQGKFFELVQLADWITKLEPRFTEVWAYHAWNLSYNISVLFPDDADRWRWVRHGFMMLRDEGLIYNPGEPRLLYELGWIFQHKIAGIADEAHMFYKQAWAAEMQILFSDGQPDYAQLLGAPRNKTELLAKPGLSTFTAELHKMGLDPFSTQSLQLPESHAAWPVIRQYPKYAETWIWYLMRQKLTGEFKLDPTIMQALNEKYGPLDWRLPQAHAIYWATLSKQAGRESDIVFANRMIYQCMADAFRRGQISSGTAGDHFILAPNPDILPFVMQAYEAAIAFPAEKGLATDAYRHFLAEAVILMFLHDRNNQAESALSKLRELNPDLAAELSVAAYVFNAYTSRFVHLNNDAPLAALSDALYQGAYWELSGNPVLAAGYNRLADMLHRRFTDKAQLPWSLDDLRTSARSRAEHDFKRMK